MDMGCRLCGEPVFEGMEYDAYENQPTHEFDEEEGGKYIHEGCAIKAAKSLVRYNILNLGMNPKDAIRELYEHGKKIASQK